MPIYIMCTNENFYQKLLGDTISKSVKNINKVQILPKNLGKPKVESFKNSL